MSENGKVLVIEDNDFVRMQIVRYLSDVGYSVQEASDGTKALEVVNGSIAVIIADVRMEPMDGFEFIKALRSRNVATPVILVTGDQNPDLLSESSKWSISTVLMKPVQKDRLVKAVERAIAQAKR
jgi:CheY-like chemotaxis protein